MTGCYSLKSGIAWLAEEPDYGKYRSPVYHIQPGKNVGATAYWT